MENWEKEFDEEFPANIQFTYKDIPRIKMFIERKLNRKKAEFYIIAEACNSKGWTFERYLKTLAEELNVKKIIN